VLYLVIF